MKTPIAITLAIVALATANAASAYHWSPPKASVHLHGKITFTPHHGESPFKCGVTMDFRPAHSQIVAVKFPHGDCESAEFALGFPWRVAIQNANSGFIYGGQFYSDSGSCIQGVQDFTTFQVNDSGIWTLTGGCLIGTMTSKPPVTIVR